MSSEISQIARKIKKQIFANPTAAPAMPAKPKIPAIIAIMRNINVQCNMPWPVQFVHHHCVHFVMFVSNA
jgi:hypothetical protein